MAACHPIERDNYLILTLPIQSVVTTMVRWIKFNFPGAMMYGERRLGKSRCVRFIRHYLAATLGFKIAIAVLCVRRHDVVREGDFLDDILDALGIFTAKRKSKGDKMDLIRSRLLILARRCPLHKVVLIIDDAQRLQRLQYEILMSIVNELSEMYNVSVFTLLVGQPELKTLRDLYVAQGLRQITGRLMADEVQFVGHRTAEELAFAWRRYHTHCFYPRGSSISYCAYWAPDAVANGWTLEKEATPIFTAYLQKREELGLTQPCEISGMALTCMAHFILREYARRPGFNGLTELDCVEVVQAAGFLQIESPVPGSNDEDEEQSD